MSPIQANENHGDGHAVKKQRSFKAGTHYDTQGRKHVFTDADVREIVESYDPALHEAPLVIGHPKTDSPAFGRVKSLELNDGFLDATPDKVVPEFADWVNKGLWNRISIAVWGRNQPGNPKPGKFYLRHIGYLGGTPPAVAGLPVASFAAGDDVIEFADWNGLAIAGLFRRIKNWLIDKEGQEKADQVIPEYDIEGIQLRAAEKDAMHAGAAYAQPQNEATTMMTAEEIRRKDEEQKRRDAELAEREKRLKADEDRRRNETIAARVGSAVKAGKLLPRDAEPAVAFAASLDAAATIEFGQGAAREKKPSAEWFLSFLESLPVRVDFHERARPEAGDLNTVTFAAPPGYAVDSARLELHNKALAYQREHPNTSYDAALAAVSN